MTVSVSSQQAGDIRKLGNSIKQTEETDKKAKWRGRLVHETPNKLKMVIQALFFAIVTAVGLLLVAKGSPIVGGILTVVGIGGLGKTFDTYREGNPLKKAVEYLLGGSSKVEALSKLTSYTKVGKELTIDSTKVTENVMRICNESDRTVAIVFKTSFNATIAIYVYDYERSFEVSRKVDQTTGDLIFVEHEMQAQKGKYWEERMDLWVDSVAT
jgi:hypothetical protein